LIAHLHVVITAKETVEAKFLGMLCDSEKVFV
jgi:hypothetical protein